LVAPDRSGLDKASRARADHRCLSKVTPEGVDRRLLGQGASFGSGDQFGRRRAGHEVDQATPISR